MSHPMIYAGKPMTPHAIVALFLDGTRNRAHESSVRRKGYS
jgi:hypothetical protein